MVILNPNRAIVRKPSSSFGNCISTHPLRHSLNLSKALSQHARYCEILSELGLDIIYISPNNAFPDSCFVEDNAIINNGRALICRMGVYSRRGEETVIENYLKNYMKTEKVINPGTIEGGDVIHLTDRLICGVTIRTNSHGIDQLKNWVNIRVDTCIDPNIIHLKSYATYLGNNTIVATTKFAKHPTFKDFTIIELPEKENYAADTLMIRDTVLLPEGYPNAQKLIKQAGFEVMVLNMSEFMKCGGALTCLSIIF